VLYGANHTPEQAARGMIDERLRACGWHVQGKDALDFNAELGIAVCEYQTSTGPSDYVPKVTKRKQHGA
jgi:type I restriction enzyme R subunit